MVDAAPRVALYRTPLAQVATLSRWKSRVEHLHLLVSLLRAALATQATPRDKRGRYAECTMSRVPVR
jgi:hypothetical protein